MSVTEARTNTPAPLSIGFNPISTGNSAPSFLRPNRSRPAPIGRLWGSAWKVSRRAGCLGRIGAGTSISTS